MSRRDLAIFCENLERAPGLCYDDKIIKKV